MKRRLGFNTTQYLQGEAQRNTIAQREEGGIAQKIQKLKENRAARRIIPLLVANVARRREQRERARDDSLMSPFRKYREREGGKRLTINGKPYTGVEECKNVNNDEFAAQFNIYSALAIELTNSNELVKEHWRYTQQKISDKHNPRLKNVYLNGGIDDLERTERDNINNILIHPKITGRALASNKEIYLSRLNARQTAEDYNRLRRIENIPYAPEASISPILRGLHEQVHIHLESSDMEVDRNILNYEFGNDESHKRIVDIVHADLANYPHEEFGREVVGHLAEKIASSLRGNRHESLGGYLKNIVNFYEGQGMPAESPSVFNVYKQNADLFNLSNTTADHQQSTNPIMRSDTQSIVPQRPDTAIPDMQPRAPTIGGAFFESSIIQRILNSRPRNSKIPTLSAFYNTRR